MKKFEKKFEKRELTALIESKSRDLALLREALEYSKDMFDFCCRMDFCDGADEWDVTSSFLEDLLYEAEAIEEAK